MSKIQKLLTYVKSDQGFFLFLLVFIAILFLALSPKISSLIFQTKRQMLLNNFLQVVKQENKIDGQTYWRFRESYSPGYFTFSKNGVEKDLLRQTWEKIGIKQNVKNVDLTFLVFSSP